MIPVGSAGPLTAAAPGPAIPELGQVESSVPVGFGFGGARLAMFMRVGGGTLTEAADVGADRVGQVVDGVPEGIQDAAGT